MLSQDCDNLCYGVHSETCATKVLMSVSNMISRVLTHVERGTRARRLCVKRHARNILTHVPIGSVCHCNRQKVGCPAISNMHNVAGRSTSTGAGVLPPCFVGQMMSCHPDAALLEPREGR